MHVLIRKRESAADRQDVPTSEEDGQPSRA